MEKCKSERHQDALTSEMPCIARTFRGFFMDTGRL